MENIGLQPCSFLRIFGQDLVGKMDALYADAEVSKSKRTESRGQRGGPSIGTSLFDQRTVLDFSARTHIDVTGSAEAEREKTKREEEQRRNQQNFLIGLSAAVAAIWATWRAGSYIQESNDAFKRVNEADIVLRTQPPSYLDLSGRENEKARDACGRVFNQFRDFYAQKSWRSKVSGGFALAIAAEATMVAVSAFYQRFVIRNAGIVALGLTALGAIFTYAVSPKAQLSPNLLNEIMDIRDVVARCVMHESPSAVAATEFYQRPAVPSAPPSYENVVQSDYNAQLIAAGFDPVFVRQGGLEWTRNRSNLEMFWRFPGSQEWNFAGYSA
ncbi:MAG: hypothetical protein LVR00_05140 [Rhabdochlamydiaceae bacterium]|jgi:hypothetical protein